MKNSGSAFFNEDQQQRIIDAIKQAEKNTSGEIRLHVEPKCPGDPFDRATQIFASLGMADTALKNGVLFYIAYEDHKIAVIGDSGIHEKVTSTFWNEELELLQEHFKEDRYADGLCKAIIAAGEKLKHYFPFLSDDKDELSNDISYGKNHE